MRRCIRSPLKTEDVENVAVNATKLSVLVQNVRGQNVTPTLSCDILSVIFCPADILYGHEIIHWIGPFDCRLAASPPPPLPHVSPLRALRVLGAGPGWAEERYLGGKVGLNHCVVLDVYVDRHIG